MSATNGILRQADAKKKKRKDRDAVFAQQARSRRSAKDTTTQPEALATLENEDASAEAQEAAIDEESPRKRKLEAPHLLPPELLESDDEEEDARPREQLSIARPKKIKLDVTERLTQHEPQPLQDEKIGTTVYRVTAERGNGKLAPKATKESWQLREKLLARHRLPEKKGAFLVKKR